MKVGFTGTRLGMTLPQLRAFQLTVCDIDTHDLVISEFHHGDCVGADTQAHDFMQTVRKVEVHIHPPIDPKHRAWNHADVLYDPQKYHTRNRAIMRRADVAIACPENMKWRPGSGTWGTIVYARQRQKPLALIYPDGTVNWERKET